jgi:(p)ppGpp synthase/HD superfamily hydrolase
MTLQLERALRWAAHCHRDQKRRVSDVPYIQHAVAVAMIVDRLGFPEDVVIAGLLHDVVEDTEATLEQVHDQFGAEVAGAVRDCSEIKLDAEGRKRPWIDRKRDHIEALEQASVGTLAVVLADKLHNLLSIQIDLEEGRDVWSTFHADRSQVLWYYRTMIERYGKSDRRLEELARACWDVLAAVEAMLAQRPKKDAPGGQPIDPVS